MNEQSYTPPLGSGDTADYDRTIGRWTREMRWRRAMLGLLDARAGETVLDIGCGTGSFAIMLKSAAPGVTVIGVDPDDEAVAIARAKAEVAGLGIELRQGFGDCVEPGTADAVVSSLVLHQVPMAGKRASLAAMHSALRSGGRLLIADYGKQRGLMRLLFRLTVQLLDGVADTQPNADGVLPRLIADAGFVNVRECLHIHTMTGTIALITAERPG